MTWQISTITALPIASLEMKKNEKKTWVFVSIEAGLRLHLTSLDHII